MEKDQSIEDTYNSIFLESKLFKNSKTVSNMELKDVAEFAYMNFVALWVMYNEKISKETAIAYADRTASFGTFKIERKMATDLYVAVNTLLDQNSSISKKLSDSDTNDSSRHKIAVNQLVVKSFLDSMSDSNISDNDASRFFLKAQRMFNISNTNIKSIGRDVSSWNSLHKEEKHNLLTKITRYFNTSAKKSEIKPMLDGLANTHGIDNNDEAIKNLAIAAGTLAAGYAIGKLAAKVVDAKRLMR